MHPPGETANPGNQLSTISCTLAENPLLFRDWKAHYLVASTLHSMIQHNPDDRHHNLIEQHVRGLEWYAKPSIWSFYRDLFVREATRNIRLIPYKAQLSTGRAIRGTVRAVQYTASRCWDHLGRERTRNFSSRPGSTRPWPQRLPLLKFSLRCFVPGILLAPPSVWITEAFLFSIWAVAFSTARTFG